LASLGNRLLGQDQTSVKPAGQRAIQPLAGSCIILAGTNDFVLGIDYRDGDKAFKGSMGPVSFYKIAASSETASREQPVTPQLASCWASQATTGPCWDTVGPDLHHSYSCLICSWGCAPCSHVAGEQIGEIYEKHASQFAGSICGVPSTSR
jgi:hypothetical protein